MVVFVHAKGISSIKSMLNKDFKIVSNFFTENESTKKLKSDKTECMLEGTSRKFSTVCKQL